LREVDDVFTDDTYQGFDYLVWQLAAEGYVAMSVNIAVDFTDRYGGRVSSSITWRTS